MSKVFLTLYKKSLKLFKEFKNGVKGTILKSIKTIRIVRDGKYLSKEDNEYLYRIMFDIV